MPTSTSTTTYPRPAGLGDQCDNWYPNPASRPYLDLPALLRCQDPATVRLTILDRSAERSRRSQADCYDVKRCVVCAGELRRKAASGATFEILAEVAL